MSLDQSERSEWSREQAQNLIFTFFLIIIIITRCSGMFHVPGFIHGLCETPFQTPFEPGNQFNGGVLSQSASSNHALLIKENALCLSQSAFSNFTLHVIIVENTRLRLVFSTSLSCSQMTIVFYHSVIHGLGFFIC